MMLYELKGKKLTHIRSNPFKLEKDIQDVVEENLEELFGLEFVKSELSVEGFRFDTLGFDKETNSFVIVEYKKGTNYSVIDQGYSYLSILLNNKSDFILEYNEQMGRSLRRNDVDWSQSRIIFISPQFTNYQKHSINFQDVPFELWEVKRFQGGFISFTQHKPSSTVSITTVSSGKETVVSEVSKVVKRYDEEYILNKSKGRTPEFKEFYYNLRNRVLELGEVEIKVNGKFISLHRDNKPFVDFIIYQNKIGISINLKKGELKDVLGKCKDQSDKQHWGSGDYIIWIDQEGDLDYVMSLIKQSYDKQGD